MKENLPLRKLSEMATGSIVQIPNEKEFVRVGKVDIGSGKLTLRNDRTGEKMGVKWITAVKTECLVVVDARGRKRLKV